jgi:hypothetical protein
MALTLPKLAVPKFAVPKLALGRKQILTIVGGVVVAAAAGWFGWQYFEDSAPPPAKPQPAAAKPPGPAKAAAPAAAGPTQDKLIADVLAASGLTQQLNQLPQQLISGVRQSGKPYSKASAAALAAIEQAVTESFTAQNFNDRLSADLKKNFEQKRVQALLGDLSAPAAKHMIELEQAAPSSEELAQFARSQTAGKMSPERKALITRIDTATKASDLAVATAFISMKALALGIAGEQAQPAAAVDKAIEKQRISSTANIRNTTFGNLAFSYRNASDAELEAQAKLYETENYKWFSGIVYASLLEETKSAAAKAGERAGALASKAGKPAATETRPVRSKSGGDARACLDLTTNAAIINCAQQYR